MKLWEDLACTDEAVFSRALVRLAASPKETIAFVKGRLKPVSIDAARVEQLLKDLDGNEFAAWTRAAEELEYLGKYAKPLLHKALTEDRPLEVKKRLQELGTKFPQEKEKQESVKRDPTQASTVRLPNGVVGARPDPRAAPPPPTGPSTLWLRAVRAVALLEVVGTPEAREVLDNLSQGEAEALPTKAAKEALERLKGNPSKD